VSWILATLTDTAALDAGEGTVAVAAINPASPDGAALLTSAAYVAEYEHTSSNEITLAQIRDCIGEMRMRPLNGDGVIVPESAQSADVAEYISAAIEATGGAPDLSGKTGLTDAQLSDFRAAVDDYLAFVDRGEKISADILIFGDETPAAYALLKKHEAAIDGFFILAGFRDFDPDNAGKFLSADGAASDASAALGSAPLAKPDSEGRLPLRGELVNPVRAADIAEIRDSLFSRVLGQCPDSATSADWAKVKSALTPYGAYLDSKKGAIAEAFPQEKLRKWQAVSYYDAVAKLIEADKDVSRRAASVGLLEKLALFNANLLRFLNNFVSLSEFYNPKKRSLFERGSAVIDGRWFNFAIETADPAAHSAVAKDSGIFTLYLRIENRDAAEPPRIVAVPATSGTRGNLFVGKRGVFFDVNGFEHDAVITQIIENPISLLEAILAPFVKIGKLIMGKIEGLSNAAEDAIVTQTDAAVTTATTLPSPAATGATPPPPPTSPMTMLMGLSISIAALGSGFAVLTRSFSEMTPRARTISLCAGVFIILFPIILSALIKLASQDLSAILEGCGWAVNQRMRLTSKLRKQFTERKRLKKK
ncbi:MAG: hypothetical protein FWG05_05725, partial [Kiritimatiellaeota bacterium]|nr:hypothetical protein [Kiritimatiellota bacterium]